MSDDKDPLAVSRRVVIGAAGAASVVADADAGGAAPANEALARCAEWMVLDGEITRLGLRWSELESIQWEEMRRKLMRTAPTPTEEMDAIDEQLKPLFRRSEEWLEALPAVRARDMYGVVAKLEVALQVMVHQQGDGYDLFKATMEELRGARCPRCGSSVC